MADPRGISLSTPLGADKLLLVGFEGTESISELFKFELDLVAENRQVVAFDALIGQKVCFSIVLPDTGKTRYFSGICSSMAQSGRDSTFTTYKMEVVPQLWLLTRRHQSRIFQQLSVPDILKTVLTGIDIKSEIQGTFEKRDYCVQYRESDFDFASRLMEEEGIYYFFKHTDGNHQMILGNSPQSHLPVPETPKAIYEEMAGGNRPDMRVDSWEKVQELRSAKVTLWDHSFELPGQSLDAERPTAETVEVGKVSHKLKLPANEPLELYDYPGGYAGRFDGVDRGGGDQTGSLQKIFQDNKRTAAIRMEQEAAQAIRIHGTGNCRQFTSGHKFTLEKHFNADGAYVLTSVSHAAKGSTDFRSGGAAELNYSNSFTCLPIALPYRPPIVTPRPYICGAQTAVVVGPPGEEIFTDKYSRVKVQFPWDRQGKKDANSSCWIRVATIWAGKGYGVIHIPRIGQEVVVEFMEGDPDQPIIIGSVYNAENMPAAKLPDKKMVSGLKSATYPGSNGFNGTVCDDTKGKEMITVHGQYDMSTTVEHDDSQLIKNDRTIEIQGKQSEKVKKEVKEQFDDTQTTTVKKKILITSTDDEIEINAKTQIKLICGDSSITLKKDGTIQISGKEITTAGTSKVVMGVSAQSVTCDSSKTAVAGTEINASATGNHTIAGAMVKIN